jgi:transaldolase
VFAQQAEWATLSFTNNHRKTGGSMNRIQELYTLGQSVWLDFIERGLIQSGELDYLVDDGVAGVTSNPTIFQQAISKSPAYEADLKRLAAEETDAKTIYEAIAIADVQGAADVMHRVYVREGGHDGFVSLEVAPTLAWETEATIAEARRLHAAVNRPNLMIKVPATEAGIPAIRQLIADGINVNVTLIFALDRYAAVKEAYIAGLEDRLAAGKPIDHVASVASFFVSRVDTNIDARLEAIAGARPEVTDEALALRGTAAVANAKLAYRQFEEVFSGQRWQKLADAGARVQRPLWASTSSKNPAYSDLIYVEPLMGPHTVNTMPPQTLDALRDHGKIHQQVDVDVDVAKRQIEELEALGVSIHEVTTELEIEGVRKFADSFADLLATIKTRRSQVAAG